MAAAVGKQLLEANLELRQRHTSLISKYPAPPSSVTPSSIPFPGAEPSWIPELDAASPVTASRTPTLSRAPSHSRRFSVTPQALAALSEHNTDLLAQLTQIEDETSRANLDGKRKLRQLEKEITGLRAELDFAQERNGELEEQIENAEHVKQMDDKKREREAKLKALRARASTATGEGVKDYAPAHPFSGSPIPAIKTPKRRIPTTQTEGGSSDKEETPLITSRAVLDFEDGLSSPGPRPTSLGPVSAGEFAVISQLLAKIEELEKANREMVAASRDRDERLRKVTEEANVIRQAYENLEEDEADDEDEAAAAMRSMVFKRAAALRSSGSSGSLGRRLRRDRGQSTPSLRGKGKEQERLSILGTPKSGKTRRALSRSLFEPPSTRDEGEQADSEDADDVNTSRRRPHSRSGSGDKTPQLRFVTTSVDDLSSEFSIAEDGYQRRFTKMPPSPMMNKLRLASPRDALDLDLTFNNSGLSPLSMEGFTFHTSSPPPNSSSVPRSLQSTVSRRSLLLQGHTLGSELGSEFGEGWSASAIKDELLFDDDSLVDGDEEQINPDPNFSGSSSQAPLAIEFLENPAVSAIRAALDPRNQGKLLQQDEHILPLGSLAGTPGETFFLLEHAVQARPTVWKEPNAERVKLALLERSRGHRALPSSADVEAEGAEEKNEDPWADKYEESGFEQSEVKDAKGNKDRSYSNVERPTMEERNRSWKRREAAKGRLERTAARRLSLIPGAGGTFDPNPNKERQKALATIEELDGDKRLVKKRKDTKDDAVMMRGEGVTANLSKTIVELWILLQAIVVIVVFVYSMARRGPRAILDAAEVRRPR